MKRYSSKQETTLKTNYTNTTVKNSVFPYIELFTEEALWRDMELATEVEDYETAIIYRDELIRRGVIAKA